MRKAQREKAVDGSKKEDVTEDMQEEGDDKEKSNKQIPLPGNGGVTANYRWSQTLEEVTVYVPLPDNVTSKQLDVKILSNKLRVGVKGQTPMIDGEWSKKIKPDDSIWTLESDGGKRILQMTLQKADGMSWWDCVIQGDPQIDTQKIEPENSKLSDLDGETRSTVEKMMFDQ